MAGDEENKKNQIDPDQAAMESEVGGDLVAGGGSERSNLFPKPKQSENVEKELTEQEKESMQVIAVSEVLAKFIAKEKADIESYHSYLKTILARNDGKQPKEEDITAEFRAREMYIAMLDRLNDKVIDHATKTETKVKQEAKKKQF